MPIETTWLDNTHRVILFTFSGRWTWDEFFEADEVAGQMAAGQEHMVDAIFDFAAAPMLPDRALTSSLNAARRSSALKNQGLTVVINANRVVAVFLRAIETLAPGNVTSAEDLEAAQERIAQERARRAAKRDDKLSE